VIRSPLARAFLASAALSAAIALSGCITNGTLPMSERAAQPLSEKMVAEIESKDMDKDSPILVRLFKQEAELEVWKQDRTGRFALLKTYPICRWSGELGPKIREGDRQAPEGFYNITPAQMNPNSQYYLSFDLGYPNAYDRAHGRTGTYLMVHGNCSSRGCYSMTDEQISEIYALGRDAFFGGQKSFQVQAYPFRMTPQNLAKHRSNPNMAFWRMLKQGNDHFEVARLEPKVDVCEKRYVFDAAPPAGSTRPLSIHPTARCPAYEVPPEIASAVREKQRQDDIQTAALIRRGTPVAPIRTYADGGMHPVFVAAVKRNEIGVAPPAFSLVSAPGTIPATVRPPIIPELADAPVMTGAAPTSSPAGPPPVLTATAEPETAQAKPAAKPGGLFNSLFASNSAETAKTNNDDPLNRMARLMGLKSSDQKPKQTAAVPASKPRPEHKSPARQTPVASRGANRPKPADNEAAKMQPAKAEPANTESARSEPATMEPVTTAKATPAMSRPATPPAIAPAWAPAAAWAPASVAAQAAAPAPTRAPTQASANVTMNGAARVVPAGTFEGRWSAFR